jgi:large subunit ribosomal protein L2
MAVKKYNPTTPGRRHAGVTNWFDLTQKAPEKSLVTPLHKTGGRNVHGFTTSRFRGGGSKRKYRIIDFKRDKDNIPAKVASIEYDPNRSARIALLNYADGEKRYILAPEGLVIGQTVISGAKVEPAVGNSMPLSDIPTGMSVHCVEFQPGRGGKMARSAGTAVQLSAKEGDYAHLIMRSGEVRRVLARCRATIGQVGNLDHMNVRIGKAGRMRWRGRRPHVRGTAQNPVSHPMGGGEGRTGGGRHPVSPWGKPAKGGKTRKRKSITNNDIIRRRKNKRSGK